MTKDKKPVPQFKLNYFDIIKGVLFPQIGKPPEKPAATPAATPATPPPSATPVSIPPASAAPAKEKPSKPKPDAAETREKRLRAVWTIGSVASILVNVVLIVIVLVLVNQVFVLKQLVGEQLLGGLYENFILMDQANITTTITVEDEIPIDFVLDINQDTTVVLTEPTRIYGAYVSVLSAPADIVLPAGTSLPVKLSLSVPVQKTIPVKLIVPVDIPLEKTELHEPFTGLQNVVSPYYWMLKPEWQKCNDALPGALCFFFANP
jgi:hypothetical protein